jgi:hypothetical protein
MQSLTRFSLVRLIGVALLLLGLGGCSPGPVVWRAAASPASLPPQEGVQ